MCFLHTNIHEDTDRSSLMDNIELFYLHWKYLPLEKISPTLGSNPIGEHFY